MVKEDKIKKKTAQGTKRGLGSCQVGQKEVESDCGLIAIEKCDCCGLLLCSLHYKKRQDSKAYTNKDLQAGDIIENSSDYSKD